MPLLPKVGLVSDQNQKHQAEHQTTTRSSSKTVNMRPNATYEKLSKLCPGDRFPTQQRILDDAHILGIGQWFLDHRTTQKWLSGDDSQILWLHGPST